jgi:hypothetical protein
MRIQQQDNPDLDSKINPEKLAWPINSESQ